MTGRHRRPRPAALAATLLALLLPTAAGAQAAAPPSADALLARHVAAVGGEAAVRRLTATRATGTVEMPGTGLKGTLTMLAAAPNRAAVRIVLPGLGELASGFDGSAAWEVSPFQGARLLGGAELERVREETDFHGEILRSFTDVVGRETVERRELDGIACWAVRVRWRSGRESHECYAVDDGLLVATWARRESARGVVETTVLLGAYREHAGVKLPTRLRQRAGALEQVITLTAIELGPADAAAFAPPPAVAALLSEREAR